MMFHSICGLCAHLDNDEDGLPVCAAFPDGIPDEIARQGFDHRSPFEGDDGILFEPDEGVTPRMVDARMSDTAQVSEDG